ncbi:MAG: DUF885 family protein, partial [Proteobacteria bacterium]|nr:DUF885 family protein [Pseudomonadota bacterium]
MVGEREVSAQEDVLVRLLTTRGDIVLALDVGRAPRSAGAFLDAVERGAFEGVAFTRVVRTDNDHGAPTIEVVQTLPSRTEGPPEAIPHEPTNETGLRHVAGAVSLARAAPGSATPTTFFICLSDQPALDHGGLRQPDGQGFAVFGQVVEGMDVAHEIQAGATTDAAPVPYLRGQLLAEPVAIVGARCEADSPLDRFDHLAADYWAFRAREFPHEATAAGDDRYNDRLGGIGLGDHARRARLASALLARARALQPSSLDRARRTSLDLLVGQLETLTEAWRLGDHLTPKLFPFGFTEIPAYLVRSTPLGSARDFEDLVARLRGIPAYLEGGRETLREGASRGYRLPRVLAARVRGLVEAQLAPTGL